MNLLTIVGKNLRQRALSTTLTMFSIALGIAVTISILALKEQAREGFSQGAFGYDLLIGPKGSKLQLVLNVIYHMDEPPGNIPWALYERLKTDRRVRVAAPVAMGDWYEGHRLVGTSDRFLADFEVQKGQKYELAEGRLFKYDEDAVTHLMTAPPDHKHDHEEGVFEAVLGSRAAAATGLKVGGTFVARHGSMEGEAHSEKWTVAGILKPTGTPADRAIYINLDSFFHIGSHGSEKETRGKIGAVAVKTKAPNATNDLEWEFMVGSEATAARPALVVAELFDMIGQVDILLLAVSVLVVVVAGVSILVSIYNSMADRKRPIAIMRALGARRSTIFSIIVLESTSLCLVGGILGATGGHGLVWIAASALRAKAGVVINPFVPGTAEPFVFLGLLVLGVIVGIIPAIKAYRTDIGEGLNPTT